MTRPTRPEVSDPKLRTALDRVGPHIENYRQNLDLISRDIKAVEEYLTTSGVRMVARVQFGTRGYSPSPKSDVTGDYPGAWYKEGMSR